MKYLIAENNSAWNLNQPDAFLFYQVGTYTYLPMYDVHKREDDLHPRHSLSKYIYCCIWSKEWLKGTTEKESSISSFGCMSKKKKLFDIKFLNL